MKPVFLIKYRFKIKPLKHCILTQGHRVSAYIGLQRTSIQEHSPEYTVVCLKCLRSLKIAWIVKYALSSLSKYKKSETVRNLSAEKRLPNFSVPSAPNESEIFRGAPS